jgi:hypothetical protein
MQRDIVAEKSAGSGWLVTSGKKPPAVVAGYAAMSKTGEWRSEN